MLTDIKKFYNKIMIQNLSKKNNSKIIFTKIYEKNYWGDSESFSGPGSNNKNTREIILKLRKICKKYKIKSIVDAPCGDFYWIQKLIKTIEIKYLGLDIVKKIISDNKKLYSSKNIKFQNIDITKKKIPNCDLIICRDFIFHLSYFDIMRFFKNLCNCKFKYILISNHFIKKDIKKKFKNQDIHTGDFRKINLFDSPFNFLKNYNFYINDFCDEKKKYLIFFSKKKIRESIKNYLN